MTLRAYRVGAVAIILSILSAGGVAASTAAESPSAIHAGAIRAHLEFLAGDLMEGREAGTRGYDLAANYVASIYQQIGLQPAGTNAFMQPVPLRSSILVPNSVVLSVQGASGIQTFTDSDHVAARPSSTETDQSLEADCVFAGFGIVSPEHKRDDYAGLDVRGKFVVVLGGPPPGLPSEVAGHLGTTAEQRSRAAERGALGVFIVYTPALEARWPFVRLAAVYAQPQMEWFDPSIPRPPDEQLRVSALIDEIAAGALFERAPRTLQAVMKEARTRAPRGFELTTRAKFARRSQHSEAMSANVVGMLPGSDSAVSNEVIAFTSHLDHVGIGVPVNGDKIYNGALDNAAGIAAMLEVARVLAKQRQKLRWSQQHLHQPSDDLNQPFDYGHMVHWAELFRRWTERTANADERPLWYENDYFGQRFAPAARKVGR